MGSLNKICLIVCAGLPAIGAWSAPARAFSLRDHYRITVQAIAEFDACTGDGDLLDPGSVVEADLAEDLNPIRKGLFYSHYYNPLKQLDMIRYDSSVSVKEAEAEIRVLARIPLGAGNVLGSMDSEIGRLVHYLQDAAAPPHVIPVDHGLSDGFESYQPDGLVDALATATPCEGFDSVPRSFMTILRDTALTTLNRTSEVIPTDSVEGANGVTWQQAFWQPSVDSSFGQYGELGNSFGKSSLVSDRDYLDFKVAQMRLAIDATKRALYLYRAIVRAR